MVSEQSYSVVAQSTIKITWSNWPV